MLLERKLKKIQKKRPSIPCFWKDTCMEIEAVENIFKGIRPAVVALIAAPTFSMAKSAKINKYNVWIPIVSALLIWLLGVSPVYIIALAGVGGFIFGKLKHSC